MPLKCLLGGYSELKNQQEKSIFRLQKPGTEHLVSFAIIILLLFLAFIFSFFSWESLRYTSYNDAMNVDVVHLRKDSVLVNLLVLFLVVLSMTFLTYCFKKFPGAGELAVKILLPIACLWVAGISIWWAFASGTTPEGDQLIVSAAAVYAKEGNLIMLTHGGYLFIYPQQIGLMGLFELLFRIAGDYRYDVIYVIYGLLNGLAAWLGYRIISRFVTGGAGRILYLLLISTCFPYFIFTNFIYGDIPSICLCMLMFLFAIKWEESGRYRNLLILCAAGALAVLVRKNSLIAVIGVSIGLFIIFIRLRSVKYLVSLFVFLAAVFGSIKGVETFYELRSGYEVEGGIPASLFIAMGLQGDITTPGRFNNYNKEIFYEYDFNRKLSSQAGWDYIRSRLEDFRKSPSDGITFMKMKLLTQWNMPTFESLVSNRSFTREPQGIVWSIYNGFIRDKMVRYLDRYQFVVYAGALAAILLLFRKRQPNIGFYIPLIVICGGFLFSIIWEAKCRYVLPYFIFTLPYTAYGLSLFASASLSIYQNSRLKIKEKYAKEYHAK
jgi:hypothetical protein